jgi:UDP-N-acetylglucosamine--N-acetylmuramyl-(pentapeptide) pyrophosphoryl-undecaprenol N-acetylglucosamine transferase
MIVEVELSEERLLGKLQQLLAEDNRRQEMGERARALAHPAAVKVIGEMVLQLAKYE